jgi:EAL domain-containing protein (putative c-di-GMP-specific phosphodiesterase class I)/GGDEF domain-containing protein
MNPSLVAPASNSEFDVRVRQAIRSARNSLPQLAVLVFSLDRCTATAKCNEKDLARFQNAVLMRLRGGLRETDSVALLSNGHFGVLLQSVQGAQDLDLIINRLLGRLDEPIHVNNVAFMLEPRIGTAIFPENGDTVESLLEYAELDLAANPDNRKPHVVAAQRHHALFSPRQWMTELRQAIVSDQLFLTYQPKVFLADGRITGVEALLRWQHHEHGVIAPDQFIPVAERTGLIIPLTLWVLQQSLLQCREWQTKGLDISVAVNLTMWNLEAQELPDQIEALLRDTGVAPQNLELEITETSIMSDPQRVIRTLNQIRELGVRFAIDDFGTGYSSFAYLTKLPVSCIKIDKSFVQNIETDRDSSMIVKSIIDLSHNLGMKVVAEGVESAAARNLLTEFGCDDGQGYYFCRPIPGDAATKFLSNPPSAVVSNNGTAPHANGKERRQRAAQVKEQSV